MATMLQLETMSREDKLIAMEAIWADLSKDSAAIESPSWHKSALEETEKRVANGEESPIDWEIAKRQLRQTPA
jgi:hypothetical protein